MASGNRTLKLSILADIDNLKKNLTQGSKEAESFGDKLGAVAKKAAVAFAAIGAAAIAASVDFAKAAAEDQQAANRLAQTLDAVTKATDAQIKSVDKWITTTSVATGITDDQLRPAFERLARSTKDVEESQKLLNLALDLSAATGKPLEAVTTSLAKAYDGSYTSLQRLGVGIDANLIKSKDFDAIYKQLNGTFGEFSEKRSEEAIVKFQRLQVAVQEAKEQVGAALLPIFEKLGDWLLKVGVPRLNAFVAGLTGDKSLSSSLNAAEKNAEEFGSKLRGLIDTIINWKDQIVIIGGIIAGLFVASKIAAGIQGTIVLVKTLTAAYKALKVQAALAAIATYAAANPLRALAAGAAITGMLIAASSKIGSLGEGSDIPEVTEGLQYDERGYLISSGIKSSTSSVDSDSGFSIDTSGVSSGPSGSSSSSTTSTGKTKLTGIPLLDALQKLDNDLKRTNRQLKAGEISPYVAEQRLNQFLDLQASLLGEAVNAGAIAAPMDSISGGVRRGEYGSNYGGITINVNAPSAIDETGFVRSVVDALNSVERRQAGGASALVGL